MEDLEVPISLSLPPIAIRLPVEKFAEDLNAQIEAEVREMKPKLLAEIRRHVEAQCKETITVLVGDYMRRTVQREIEAVIDFAAVRRAAHSALRSAAKDAAKQAAEEIAKAGAAVEEPGGA